MKYTRYDLKRRNNDGFMFLLVFIGILVLAFIIGSIVSQIVYKDYKVGSTSTITPNKHGTIVRYIAIQSAHDRTKEYADKTKDTLSAYGNPFVITEQDKSFRVFLGIFTEVEADKNTKILTDKKIDNSEMAFKVSKDNLCDAEIIAILDGNLQILSALISSNIKSIPTASFKKYCSTELKDVDKSSAHYAELNELKTYVKNMTEQISKDNAADNYTEIYNILKKITGK